MGKMDNKIVVVSSMGEEIKALKDFPKPEIELYINSEKGRIRGLCETFGLDCEL